MASNRRIATGLVAGLGLVFLALGQFGTTQADAGRDFPRCVQSCNETRAACKSQCQSDCGVLFPNDSEDNSHTLHLLSYRGNFKF